MARLTGGLLGNRLLRWIALSAGLAVILAGSAYILLRGQNWHSTAALSLTPVNVSSADRATVFDSFDQSGTMGTYVELISSRDTLDRAGSPPVSVEVRAVPASRVIDVTATGSQNEVQPAVRRLIAASMQLAPRLGDPWSLTVLERPSEPAKAGPSNRLLVVAIILLAALAAIAAAVIARELGVASDRQRGGGRAGSPGAPQPGAWPGLQPDLPDESRGHSQGPPPATRGRSASKSAPSDEGATSPEPRRRRAGNGLGRGEPENGAGSGSPGPPLAQPWPEPQSDLPEESRGHSRGPTPSSRSDDSDDALERSPARDGRSASPKQPRRRRNRKTAERNQKAAENGLGRGESEDRAARP